MNDELNVLLLPYGANVLGIVAERLALNTLPGDRLGRCAVLTPDALSARHFKQALLTAASVHGARALLPPFVGAWDQWIGHITGVEALDRRIEELLLFDRLEPGSGATWRATLANALLTLFGEIAGSGGLPDDAAFTSRLQRAYGTRRASPPLSAEAQTVRSSWQRWCEFLADIGVEPLRWSESRLRYLMQAAAAYQEIYWLSPPRISPADGLALQTLARAARVYVVVPGDGDAATVALLGKLGARTDVIDVDQSNVTAFYEAVYASSDAPALATRARQFATQNSESPVGKQLALLSAQDLEAEAHAIEVQIRQWWLAGLRRLAIVSLDRKLARRVRALLERARLEVQDSTGWPLSTTSAATLVAHWLDAIEQDFPVELVVDLICSPFIFADVSIERRKEIVGVFRALALRTRTFRGLDAQRIIASNHSQDLIARAGVDAVLHLKTWLDAIKRASRPLTRLRPRRHPRGLSLSALLESLETLAVDRLFASDAAGSAILKELEAMATAAQSAPHPIDWAEFRRWVSHRLEVSAFEPPYQNDAVVLISPTQAELLRFEAVVLANVSEEVLANTPTSPFFNDAVRHELGLLSATEQRQARFRQLRCMLENNGRLLMTIRREDQGSPLTLSRWVERLRAFHVLAYNDDLTAFSLASTSATPQSWIVAHEPAAALPIRAEMPHPYADAQLLPTELSAAAYQQLVNCPYQYFAARQLRLQSDDDVTEQFEKRDYGELVHRVLEAFHCGVPGLAGPLQGSVTADTYADAYALLMCISEQVFAAEKQRHFFVNAWLGRWRETIPAYLDWLSQRPQWRPQFAELKIRYELAGGLTLIGRLDRVDCHGEEIAVIDYKTGTIPALALAEQCEAVQLPFYALLAQQLGKTVSSVAFVSVDREVHERGIDDRDALLALSSVFEQQLHAVTDALRLRAELPAWGNATTTCAYCSMTPLCRRGLWTDTQASNFGQKKGGQ